MVATAKLPSPDRENWKIDMSKLQVRKTRPDEIGIVRDLLVDGFWNNEACDMIHLHDNQEGERFVFEALAKFMLGHSYLIIYDGEVIGHVSVTPSGSKVVPPMIDVLKLCWSLPIRFGVTFTVKLLDMLHSIDSQTEPFLKTLPPAAMLEWFTIRSDWRGRGVGFHILKTFVTKTSERVVLTTQTVRNLGLYERSGFKIVFKHVYRTRFGDGECDSWIMLYESEEKPVARAG